MNAANPASSAPLGAEPRASEPSMEEILASIRRIIADDQSLPGLIGLRDPAPPSPQVPLEDVAAAAPAPEPVHILRLEPAEAEAPVQEPSPVAPAAHGAVAAPQFASPAGPRPEPPMFAPEPPKPAPMPPMAAPEPQTPPQASRPAPNALDIAEFNSPLGASASSRQTPAATDESALFSAATGQSISSAFNMLAATRLADNSDELLGIVREMIRPLLKAWLDDNLPSMVERLVRAEIERVSRGGH